jgi:hypothetical protein
MLLQYLCLWLKVTILAPYTSKDPNRGFHESHARLEDKLLLFSNYNTHYFIMLQIWMYILPKDSRAS